MCRSKRLFDLALTVELFPFLIPLFGVIAIAVKFTSPGPVFFRQERVGLEDKVFFVLKFRTMFHGSGGSGLSDLVRTNDSRITPVGRFLRWSHLDELPQLVNVLRGEMSLVGPRPITPKIAEILRKQVRGHDRRLKATPGITGPAQIAGCCDDGKDGARKRFMLDRWYIKNQSLRLDMILIMKTLWVMLRGKGTPTYQADALELFGAD